MWDDYKNFREVRKTKEGYRATLFNGISFFIQESTATEISKGWDDYFRELALVKENYGYNVASL